MAISAVAVTTTDTLETFRVEFNNLVADVASIEQVGASNIIISDGGNIGSASDQDAIAIASTGVVTFSQAPSFTAGITVSNLDIDGATDISAAIVDADLFIVDDGASGTNRKTAASRIKTYIADVTLTTAAQTNITSVGTLTALDVDNININGNTITASSGAVNITPASGSAIVLDGTVNIDAGVVTGVTSLTSNNILIADAGTIGSASSTSAIAIASDGDVTLVDDLKLGSDSARLFFGAGNDIIVTHLHNSGLRLAHGGSGDNAPVVFQLKSEEDAIIADEVIGSIEFAAGDSDGTDGATVAAGIHAIAEGTFSASANATRLSFTTGVSETAASSATAKMTLSSAGNLGIGTTAPTHALHVRSVGDAVLFLEADTDNSGEDDNAKIILSQDGGLSLARVGFADNSNTLEFYNELTPSTDSHIRFGTSDTERMKILQGGDVEIHADLLMDHDSALISFGADDEIRLTHDHNKGLVLTNTVNGTDDTPVIFQLKSEEDAIVAADVIASLEFAAGDSDGTDGATVAAGIHAIAEGTFSASANATKLVFTTGVSETAAASATAKMTLSSAGLLTIADDFVIKDGGTIGSATTPGAITVASNGAVTTSTNLNIGGQIIGQSHLQLDADNAQIFLGEDQDIVITHYPDSGVTIHNTATGDDKPITITLESREDDIAADDVIGRINFRAGGEDSGTDAVLIAAGIEAVSEGDFSASNNATKLSFKTAVSEIATEKMSLSSAGLLTIADDFMIKDGGTIGVASTNDAITISSAGIVTFKDDIIIKDGGTIGSASDTDAITISSGGVVTVSATTATTSTSSGALVVGGGVGIGADIRVGDDILLSSDASQLYFGAHSEIRLTHVHDVGLTVTNTIADTDNTPVVFQLKSEEDAIVADDVIASIEMAAGDSDGTDGATVAAGIHAIAEGTFSASANATKLVFTTGVSETAASSATAKMTLSSAGLLTIADDFMLKDGGTIGVASANDAMTISSAGIVTFKDDILIKDGGTIGVASDTDAISISSGGVATFTQGLTVSGGSDGDTLLTFSIDRAWAFLQSGDDASTSLVLKSNVDGKNFEIANSNGDVDFRFFTSHAGGDPQLQLQQDVDIRFEGSTNDTNRTTLTVTDPTANRTITLPDETGTVHTSGGSITIPDAGTIGSASDTDAIAISSGGVITISATTANTSTSDGALVVGGGAGIGADLTVGDDLRLQSDGAQLFFGAGNDVRLEHDHNSGLSLTNIASSDDASVTLTLKNSETDIAINDVIGAINFQSPQEATGTDAILVSAGIEAVSEGDFSSSNNATKLSFKTAASETATEKMSLSSTGNLTIAGELTTTAFASTDFAAAKIVMNRSATDGTDAGDNIIDETDSDNMLMENVTSWVTSGFTIRDSFGNHLQTVNGVS